MRRLLPVGVLAVLVLTAQSATAGAARERQHGSRLWSTIDECKAKGAKETVGVLASMPGNGHRRTQMFVRFTLQYRNHKGRWLVLHGSSTSFVAIGNGAATREYGTVFGLATQKKSSFTLRASVDFQWRHGRRVLSEHVRSSTAGHHSLRYGSPVGYSAAFCKVS